MSRPLNRYVSFVMVQSQQVQHRRVEVVVRDRLLHCLEAELVAGADHLTALDACARHQHRLCPRIVIAPEAALRDRHAAELRVHDHERACPAVRGP